MLEVRGLSLRFGSTVALDAVDLDVADGETLAVLGPSGCGKSTLLRTVAGLETPDAGTVSWDGRDLAAIPPHRRRFGLMFQDHALFPHRDVIGNVAFGLRVQGSGRSEATRRARAVLALVGLGGFDHRDVRSLSGGEQQRVALARALAPAPRLLMLDEPLGSLDRRLREDLAAELRRLFVELGTTAVFVTHDHSEAFTVADRVAVMDHGRVLQTGTPFEIWNRPADEVTARFVGFANILDAGPDRERLAVRPDGLRLDPDGPMSGVVESSAFRRDHFLVRVKVDDRDEPLVVAAPLPVAPAPGEAVRVAIDRSRAVPLGPGSRVATQVPSVDREGSGHGG